MKELWNNNKAFRTLCRQVFNAVVAYIATSLSGIEGEMQTIMIGLGLPALNLITKWINTNFFGDLGVEKKGN